MQRLLDEVLGAENRYPGSFDLLIVDEAHHCAPPASRKGARGYAVDSKQTVAVRRAGEHSSHRLFLCATPHNGYSESWQALLEMLDPQRFLRGAEPDQAVVDQVVVRRLKDQIVDSQGRRIFPDRIPRAVEVDYNDDEKHIHELLERYTTARGCPGGKRLRRAGLARSPGRISETALLRSRVWRKAVRAIGAPSCAYPTCATPLSLFGRRRVPSRSRQRARHASPPSLVLDRYGHLIPGAPDTLTAALDAMARPTPSLTLVRAVGDR